MFDIYEDPSVSATHCQLPFQGSLIFSILLLYGEIGGHGSPCPYGRGFSKIAGTIQRTVLPLSGKLGHIPHKKFSTAAGFFSFLRIL